MLSRKTAILGVIAPVLIYGAIYLGMHVLCSGWAAILMYHAVVCLVLTMAGGWSFASKLLRGWRLGAGLGFVIISSLVGAVVYIAWIEMQLAPDSIADTVESVGLQGPLLIGFGIYYAVVNPAIEEIFWRGWYGANCRWPVATDVLFAGYHVIVVVLFLNTIFMAVAFCVLIGAAWLWRLCARRYDGLMIPFASHTLADVSIMIVLFLRT
jgi:membrane protease YdiL (CAAX protease family)